MSFGGCWWTTPGLLSHAQINNGLYWSGWFNSTPRVWFTPTCNAKTSRASSKIRSLSWCLIYWTCLTFQNHQPSRRRRYCWSHGGLKIKEGWNKTSLSGIFQRKEPKVVRFLQGNHLQIRSFKQINQQKRINLSHLKRNKLSKSQKQHKNNACLISH